MYTRGKYWKHLKILFNETTSSHLVEENNMVSFANWRCVTTTSPLPARNPLTNPTSFAFVRSAPKASAVIVNKNGDSRAPCLSPLEALKSLDGVPFYKNWEGSTRDAFPVFTLGLLYCYLQMWINQEWHLFYDFTFLQISSHWRRENIVLIGGRGSWLVIEHKYLIFLVYTTQRFKLCSSSKICLRSSHSKVQGSSATPPIHATWP